MPGPLSSDDCVSPSLKSSICSPIFSEQTLQSLVRHTGLIITRVGSVLQAPASYNLSSHSTRKHAIPWVSSVFSCPGIWTCGYFQDKLCLALCHFSWQILQHALGFELTYIQDSVSQPFHVFPLPLFTCVEVLVQVNKLENLLDKYQKDLRHNRAFTCLATVAMANLQARVSFK